MKHIVQYSGGVASYAVAQLLVDEHGPDDVVLLFADTLIEDEDLYRFNEDVSNHLGIPITRVAEGRDPWQVFFDVKMMGNSQKDPCSRILKRELLRRYLDQNFDPATDRVYIGFDANEEHRWVKAIKHWKPWKVFAPLIEREIFREQISALCRDNDLNPPRLYALGFSHNNCGGFCIKAGQAQFALLLKHFPERYWEHEEQENLFNRVNNCHHAILRDRRGGTTKPMTLEAFRKRVETGDYDKYDYGGCACMEPADEL